MSPARSRHCDRRANPEQATARRTGGKAGTSLDPRARRLTRSPPRRNWGGSPQGRNGDRHARPWACSACRTLLVTRPPTLRRPRAAASPPSARAVTTSRSSSSRWRSRVAPPARLWKEHMKRITVCRDCCCGSVRKVPALDHDEQIRRLAEVADVRVTECLDVCDQANVLIVQPTPEGRAAGGRPVWLALVNDESATADVAEWVRAGASRPGSVAADPRTAPFHPAAPPPAPRCRSSDDEHLDLASVTMGPAKGPAHGQESGRGHSVPDLSRLCQGGSATSGQPSASARAIRP